MSDVFQEGGLVTQGGGTGDVTETSGGANHRVAIFTGAKDITGVSTITANTVSGELEAQRLYGSLSVETPAILLDGASTGTITIEGAADAGTWTFQLPVNDGTPNQVLSTDGSGVTSWVDQSGGGGSPGGMDTQIQFNNMGAFGGDAGLTFDPTSGNFFNVYRSNNAPGNLAHFKNDYDNIGVSATLRGLAIENNILNGAGSIFEALNVFSGSYGQGTPTATGIIVEMDPNNAMSTDAATAVRILFDSTAGVSNTGLLIADIAGATTNRAIQTGAGEVVFGDTCQAQGYKSSDGSAGMTGTLTTASLVDKTVTIKNGLITSIA